jgi:hypothetical protein
MTRTEADGYRTAGVWPTRPMTPFGPLPAPRPPRPLCFRRALDVAWTLIVLLVVLGTAGGVAYVLAAGHQP